MHGQILDGDIMPSLSSDYFRVLRVSTRSGATHHLLLLQNTQRLLGEVVLVDTGASRGGCGFSQFDKRPCQCSQCEKIIIYEKCQMKFEKPEWAQVALTGTSLATDSTSLSLL